MMYIWGGRTIVRHPTATVSLSQYPDLRFSLLYSYIPSQLLVLSMSHGMDRVGEINSSFVYSRLLRYFLGARITFWYFSALHRERHGRTEPWRCWITGCSLTTRLIYSLLEHCPCDGAHDLRTSFVYFVYFSRLFLRQAACVCGA